MAIHLEEVEDREKKRHETKTHAILIGQEFEPLRLRFPEEVVSRDPFGHRQG